MNTANFSFNDLVDFVRGDDWRVEHVYAEQDTIVSRINDAINSGIRDLPNQVEANLLYRASRKFEGDNREAEQRAKYGHITPHVSDRIELGTILYSSWGYEQTNVDFYCVVEMSKTQVKMLPMSGKLVHEGTMSMAGQTTAGDTIDFRAEIVRKKVQQPSGYSDAKPWIKMTSYAHAWLWDGRKQYVSWYA